MESHIQVLYSFLYYVGLPFFSRDSQTELFKEGGRRDERGRGRGEGRETR